MILIYVISQFKTFIFIIEICKVSKDRRLEGTILYYHDY